MTEAAALVADGSEVVAMADAGQWEAWLAERHDTSSGVWLLVAKAGSGRPSVTLAEAADVCHCFGWIDSRRRAYDEFFYLQKFSRRRLRGSWSQVNVAKVERLIADGRMRPAGLAEVAAAQADGRWAAAYAGQKDATTPPDLAAALGQDVAARAYWDSLNRTERYAVILRLAKARTPATRDALLAKAITQLADDARADS